MPTIPSSSRESSGTRSRHRSPGIKSQSMSHLNLLSSATTPRPPPRKSAAHLAPFVPMSAKKANLSRSMVTLNKKQAATTAVPPENLLKKTRASQSMSHLAGKTSSVPVAPPRMTRAERLRQKARQMATANKDNADKGKIVMWLLT